MGLCYPVARFVREDANNKRAEQGPFFRTVGSITRHIHIYILLVKNICTPEK